MHTREAFEALLAGRRLGTHLTVYGAVRPQDARSGKRLSLTPETQSRTGIRHGED